ncbi:MAG: hypothetical protein PVS3B1_10070 [Ktedonobacteraceae bacterium]
MNEVEIESGDKKEPWEAEDNTIILHRDEHFFVRATSRPDHPRNPLHIAPGNTNQLFATVLEQIQWLSTQRQHIAETDTRALPALKAFNLPATKSSVIAARLEFVGVLLGLIAACVVHAFNMFGFPLYEQDEGTYMSSAWAIVHGMLQPYPYRYDHPPLGWMQLAAWAQFTGGFFSFGTAINTGRVLMLFFAIGSSLLVYLITRHLTKSSKLSLLALVIFAFSPLSLTYQRPVFLDNIATFWLLLSLYLLIAGNSRLLYVILAGISFGIAILSKEVFVLFLPALLYVLWLYSTSFQRKFVFVAFCYIVMSLASSFLLIAVLKGELFPTGVLPWDNHAHLSLLDTFIKQVQRTQSEGDFRTSWNAWQSRDVFLLVVSSVATLFNLAGGWWDRRQWLVAFLAIGFWCLFLRGGVVFPYYIIPLLPFMVLNIVVALNTATVWIKEQTISGPVRVLLLLAFVVVIVLSDLTHASALFTQRPSSAQTDALVWVRENVSHNSVLVINDYLYTDLHEAGGLGVADGATYPYAHNYLNVAYDPELHDQLLHNDWQHIDYIIADAKMVQDIRTQGGPMLLIDRALHHAILRADFRARSDDQLEEVQIYQVLHASPAG